MPVLQEFEAFLLYVRRQLDPELERIQPVKLGKPYPLGQCLEIALAVQSRLLLLKESEVPSEVVIGFRALRAFKRSGGEFRQVWGDLRGQYFQNAFLVGTLYVDVSNDTVVPTKPKVEVLPFESANFEPIRSFDQFRTIAESYWKHKIYPNHVLPELAPHCPLIHVTDTGRIEIHEATQYMLAMAHVDAFRPSEEFLRAASMPVDLFETIRSILIKQGHKQLPLDPTEGRKFALQKCKQFREKRVHRQKSIGNKIVLEVKQVNSQLARGIFIEVKERNNMPSIKIDDKDYDLDKLSDEAKAQLKMMLAADAEIKRLQECLAMTQTARNAYARALGELLPK